MNPRPLGYEPSELPNCSTPASLEHVAIEGGAEFPEPVACGHPPATESGRTSAGDLEAISETMFTPTRVLASRHVGDTLPGAAAPAW